jgi:hypothetical protein
MGNPVVHQETSSGLARNQSAEEASRIAKELAATNRLALDCAMHQREVPTESTPKAEDDIRIPVGDIRNVIGRAFRIQGEINQRAEEANKASSLEQLNRELAERSEPTVSIQELAEQVKSLGITTDALAQAIEPSPAQLRTSNQKELARSLSLPENASRESVIFERKLWAFVENIKRSLPQRIEQLQDPLHQGVTLLGTFDILACPDTSLAFRRITFREIVNIVHYTCNPIGWIELMRASDPLNYFGSKTFWKCFDLSAPLSPALQELQAIADALGGVITFQIPRGQGPLMMLSSNTESRLQILLSLKES